MHNKTAIALKPNFMSSLFLCAIFLLICIMHIPELLLKFQIFMIKLPKYLPFKFLASNAFFSIIFHIKAAQDDISAKTVPISLHHTV